MPQGRALLEGDRALACVGGTSAGRGSRQGQKQFSSPTWSRGDDPPTDLEEDLEAGFMGLPFTQPETEHEWEDQVNWDELERETVD